MTIFDPCQQVLRHSQFADGADGLHTWRTTSNILHMRCCRTESLWSFRLWIRARVKDISPWKKHGTKWITN